MIFVIYQVNRKLCPQKTFKQMFIAALHNCQNLKVTKISFHDEQVNCGTFRNLNIIQQLKEMSSQTVKRHRRLKFVLVSEQNQPKPLNIV